MSIATLFLTRRAAERASRDHILDKGLRGAKALVKQVQKGWLKTDHGWEVTILPSGGRAYPLSV